MGKRFYLLPTRISPQISILPKPKTDEFTIMDMTIISSALSSIKTATDIAKFFKDSHTTLQEAETKLKLADLISLLADAKIHITEAQELLLNKDEEINRLKGVLSVKQKLLWEQPYYWAIDGENKDGPFCQQCYDNDNKLIRLQGNGEGYWQCATCKNAFADKNYTLTVYAPPRQSWKTP